MTVACIKRKKAEAKRAQARAKRAEADALDAEADAIDAEEEASVPTHNVDGAAFCQHFGVSEDTRDRRRAEGMPAIRTGRGRWRYDIAACEVWFEERAAVRTRERVTASAEQVGSEENRVVLRLSRRAGAP